MARIDRSAQRVIAVIALLILAAWALRGYLPGTEPVTEREPPPDNPAALFTVVALLSAAVAIMGFAIIVRLRDRRVRPTSTRALPRGSGTIGRPSWRFALVTLALVIAWLVLVMLVSRMGGPVEQPSAPPTVVEPDAPETAGEPGPPFAPEEPDSGGNVVGYLVPPMLVLMALVVIGTAIASRRNRRDAPPEADVDAAIETVEEAMPGDSLARAASLGLAEIGDLSREPREAIIACYAAMERELMRVPGAVPQAHDTPTEVLARAVDQHALRADSATELVELFEEARFSPHVMTEAHRDAAVGVLQRVLAELPYARSLA